MSIPGCWPNMPNLLRVCAEARLAFWRVALKDWSTFSKTCHLNAKILLWFVLIKMCARMSVSFPQNTPYHPSKAARTSWLKNLIYRQAIRSQIASPNNLSFPLALVIHVAALRRNLWTGGLGNQILFVTQWPCLCGSDARLQCRGSTPSCGLHAKRRYDALPLLAIGSKYALRSLLLWPQRPQMVVRVRIRQARRRCCCDSTMRDGSSTIASDSICTPRVSL